MKTTLLSKLIITKVRSVTTLFSPENKKVHRDKRSRWAMVLKYEGETIYTANGRHYVSDANHLILLPKGCSYDWTCTKRGHCAIIEFESDLTYDEPISFSIKKTEKLLGRFQGLEYKRNLKKPMMELESIRDTYEILLSVAQSAEDRYLPSDHHQKIAPAIEYLSQNYNKPLTNEELAALTGLSTVYFRKLFTVVTGTSPIAYAHELRIEKAKEMLKSDYGSLSEIAQSLGYSSLYDFSRDFKRRTGVAPSQY